MTAWTPRKQNLTRCWRSGSNTSRLRGRFSSASLLSWHLDARHLDCCASHFTSQLNRVSRMLLEARKILILDIVNLASAHKHVLAALLYASESAFTIRHLLPAVLYGGLMGSTAHAVTDFSGPSLVCCPSSSAEEDHQHKS